MCWVLMFPYNPDAVPAHKELRKEQCKVEGSSFHCDPFYDSVASSFRKTIHEYKLMVLTQVVLVVKNLPSNAGDVGSIPGLGRFPGVGNGNPFQYSCLGNSMDRGTSPSYSPWGCEGSDKTERLSTSTFTHHKTIPRKVCLYRVQYIQRKDSRIFYFLLYSCFTLNYYNQVYVILT